MENLAVCPQNRVFGNQLVNHHTSIHELSAHPLWTMRTHLQNKEISVGEYTWLLAVKNIYINKG